MKTVRQSLNALARQHSFGWQQADANHVAKLCGDRGYDVDEGNASADDIARQLACEYEATGGIA